MVSSDTPKTAHPKPYGLENIYEAENCYRVIKIFFLTSPKICTFVYIRKDRKPCEFYFQTCLKLIVEITTNIMYFSSKV